MLTTEQLEIRELAREFAEGEIRPHAAAWDANQQVDRDLYRKMGELGFLGMRAPEEFGGLDLDMPTYLVALEQIAWGDPVVALALGIHNGPVTHLIRTHGTDEQKAEWLPRLASGQALTAFALTEPDAGSDAGALTCAAERTDSGWRIRGEKRWVTNGASADMVVVFARTEPDGVSAFLVDTGDSGYRVTEQETTMGFRASEAARVTLDVEVGSDALLGEQGKGLRYALEALDVGRLGVASLCVGITAAALEHATAYASEREQFGRPLRDFGAIQGKLAGMATGLHAARALVAEVAAAFESGQATNPSLSSQAAMAKLFASEQAYLAADEAVQIFGGYGYMRDYPVEKLLRDAKGAEIFEGTNEIMRYVIARSLTSERDG